MPIEVIRIERTPNPNARKFVTPSDSPMPIRSFFAADQARSDPLGSALFGIDGVTNVLIHTNFICINKSQDSKWATIEQAVKAVLNDAR
ncbi:MAG: NifU N-terminal domain-containing protein [Phycisphaerales bacterium]|nr:NifU N-terminal domain-containing protein [Phycisphaerales bacterium]